ncbi:hypothetical protein DFH28DRAFT_915947 [Melampsora americana]|nr:hypothetical protein DFH28DRAFT_915947 [Melampsora americana]
MAANWANQNRDVSETLQSLLQAYDAGGGSSVFDMYNLRSQFAKSIPFDHPHFHRHFSIFATEAVAMDLRANRFCYPIGGRPPDITKPIEETDPYIQPTQLLQSVPPLRPATGGRDMEGEGEIRREEGQGDQNRQLQDQEGGENGGEEAEEERSERRGERRSSERETGRGRKRVREDSDRSSSSDSTISRKTRTNNSHVFSFIKNKRPEEEPLPEEAREINKLVKEYRDNNLHDAALNFCWEAGKNYNFPDALVQDLLQYKFIDLEKINAGPNTPNFSIASKSKEGDPASKIKPKPFREATEWRDAVSYLIDSLSLAFGNWRDVIPYDIALRQAFATRRHLSFADFAGDELSHLKHMALAEKRPAKDNTYVQRFNQGSSSVTQKTSSASRHTFDKKPKFDSPWVGKVKNTRNLPRNQQICGGWNLEKCNDQVCPTGRIHGMCDLIDCFDSHRRITHPSQ